MSMDYFRRPVLAGNTLIRTQNATIRGSVRRSDADGFSTTPYFPSLSGKSLFIKIESTTYGVTFASDAFAAALAAINAVIGGHGAGIANGEASDSDGTITIKSTSTDGSGNPLRTAGSVEITAGNAAAILGFDFTFHSVKALGGEVVSTPEGRIGNPFRTAFIGRGENVNADSVNRGMAMLASNMDVLYAGYNREDAMLRKVDTFTENGSYITIGAGLSVPIGFGVLSGTSNATDLSPFFQIVDMNTKQPYASRVVGVVKGTPVGVYPSGWPYTDQTVWTDNLGYNLLGQQVGKMTSVVAITSIIEGKYVTCAGTPFTHVEVEDFVEISGATNLDEQNNNGHKWVVESVISTSKIAVRPMSKGELAMVGFVPAEVQPNISLASTKQLAQSYGNIMVRTGAYASVPASQPASLNLVVYPEIQSGAPIELWMAQPMCMMDANPYDMQTSAGQPLKLMASDYDLAPNGLLSSPTLGPAGGTTQMVGSFYVRWHGRVIRVGATTTNLPVNPLAISVIYWDSDSCSVKSYLASTSPPVGIPTTLFSGLADPDPATGGAGFPVAYVLSASGTSVLVKPTSKLVNGARSSVSVGHGGDFNSIREAMDFLTVMGLTNSEVSATNGEYSHFEIVLLSDQTITESINVINPSITIRGANSSIRLLPNLAVTTPVFETQGSFTLQDLIVKSSTGKPVLVNSTSSVVSKVTLRNVAVDSTGLSLLKAVAGSSVNLSVLIEDCNLLVTQNVVDVAFGADQVTLSRSTFAYVADAGYTAPAAVDGSSNNLVIRDCNFTNAWATVSNTSPLIAISVFGTLATIENCKFSLGNHPTATPASLFALFGTALVKNCVMNTGNIGTAVRGGSINVTVEDCQFWSSGNGDLTLSGNSFVYAGKCIRNTLRHLDVSSGVNGGNAIALDTGFIADGNTIQGPFTSGVRCVGGASGIRIVNNRFIPTYAGAAAPVVAVSCAGALGTVISNNNIYMNVTDTPMTGIDADASNWSVISNNHIYFSNATAGTFNSFGINIRFTQASVVSGNVIKSFGTQTSYTANITGITMRASLWAAVTGNAIDLVGDATGYHTGIQFGASGQGVTAATVSGNTVQVHGQPFACTMANQTNIIDGNIFESSDSFSLGSGRLTGIVTNNSFRYSGAAASHPVVLGMGTFTGNTFQSVSFSFVGGEFVSFFDSVVFNDNKVRNFALAFGSEIAWAHLHNNQFADGNITDTFSVTGTTYSLFMSGCRAAAGTVTTTNGKLHISDSQFQSLAAVNSATFDSYIWLSDCVVYDAFAVSSNRFKVDGCTIYGGGAVTFNGLSVGGSQIASVTSCMIGGTVSASNSSVFELRSCYLGGDFSLTGSSSDGSIISCLFKNPANINFVGGNGSVLSCIFKGGANISAKLVDACRIAGYLVMSGSNPDMTLSNCYISGQVQFTASVSYPQFNIHGNTIIPGTSTDTGLLFPDFGGSTAGMHISITNNRIRVGAPGALSSISKCHGIYFDGNCEGLTLTGNTIEYTMAFAGAGTGTFTFALLYVVGTTGANNNRNMISSNRMYKRTNFSGGGLTITYHFVWFGQSASGSAIGAGNVLETDGSVPVSAPHDGSQFYAGVATPYTIS